MPNDSHIVYYIGNKVPFETQPRYSVVMAARLSRISLFREDQVEKLLLPFLDLPASHTHTLLHINKYTRRHAQIHRQTHTANTHTRSADGQEVPIPLLIL